MWKKRSCWRCSDCLYCTVAALRGEPVAPNGCYRLLISESRRRVQGIFKKFARLASLAAGRNEATAEELAGSPHGSCSCTARE